METTTVNLLHVLKNEGAIKIKKDKSTSRTDKIIADFLEIEKQGKVKNYVSENEMIVVLNSHSIKTFLI